MFKKARLKLMVWYLLTIMMVSLLFSGMIYQGARMEVERSLRAQQFRMERSVNINQRFVPPTIEPILLTEAENRLKFSLLIINLVILSISGVAGYFLAGRTLQPIEEMLNEQNRFITDSSHELRTPLTALKTSIEVGLRDKQMKLTGARQLLSESLVDVNNLVSFSNDLIKLTVYQKPNGNLKMTKLGVRDVLSEAIRKVGSMAKQRNVDIKQKINRVNIWGDEKSLTELFVIILDNAIKYSHDNSDVEIRSTIKGSNILMAIKDHGVGIPEEELNHIFDRFYRVDKSRSKEVSGYGLGLSIAKEIVEINKGTIRVESNLGKGSTFIVELPIYS